MVACSVRAGAVGLTTAASVDEGATVLAGGVPVSTPEVAVLPGAPKRQASMRSPMSSRRARTADITSN
jgi:hypothetical protein